MTSHSHCHTALTKSRNASRELTDDSSEGCIRLNGSSTRDSDRLEILQCNGIVV